MNEGLLKSRIERFKIQIEMVADNLCALNPGFEKVFSYWLNGQPRPQTDFENLCSHNTAWVIKVFDGIDLRLIDSKREFEVLIRSDEHSDKPRLQVSQYKPNLDDQVAAEIVGILTRK